MVDTNVSEDTLKEVSNQLDNMSLKHLMELQTRLTEKMKVVAKREKTEAQAEEARRLQEARAEIKAIALGVGMSVADLLAMSTERKASGPIPAKYRDPADASHEWSGRGRQPYWVKEWLETPGHTLAELEIKS